MKALKLGILGVGLLMLTGCAGGSYSTYYTEDVVVGVGVSSGSYYRPYYYPNYRYHYRPYYHYYQQPYYYRRW